MYSMRKLAFLLFALLMWAGRFYAAKPGTIRHEVIEGVSTTMWFPPSYSEDKYYFPALYLLHGTPGGENDWLEQGNLEFILDSIMNEGDVIDMVIVMPNMIEMSLTEQEAAAYREGRLRLTEHQMDSVCMNGRMEARFHEYLHYMEYHYNLNPSMRRRAVAGLSMGAFHAFQLSQYLPLTFAFTGMFSGVYEPLPEFPMAKEYEHMYENTIVNCDIKPVYWFAVGDDDPYFAHTTAMRQWMDKNHCEYVYWQSVGGHDWPTWQEHVARFLLRVFKTYED